MAKTHKRRFYSRYSPPPAVHLDFAGAESMTKQEFRDECDINVLLSKYQVSGVQVSGNPRDPLYGDFSSLTSFHDAQNLLLRAQEQFAGLSSKVRDRFKNDPALFLAFVADPKNVDEAESLGMLNEDAVKRLRDARERAKAIVTPPPAPVAPTPAK